MLAAVAMVFLGAVVAGAVGQWHQEQSICQDVTSRMNDVWDAPRQEAVRRALLATGQPYAADAWTGVKGALDTYASAWVEQQRRACEATRLRGETSEERFAVHTACLERRRSELRALTGLLAEADSAVVEHAVEAVRGLSEFGPCESMDGVPAPLPGTRARRPTWRRAMPSSRAPARCASPGSTPPGSPRPSSSPARPASRGTRP
ncbi:hypothetical protein ACN28S_57410 [Cystobacter fuscus]